MGSSFVVIFAAEWGDLSHLLTWNFVAKHGHPVEAFIGSWTALLAVSGLTVLLGRVLLRHVRLSLLHDTGRARVPGLRHRSRRRHRHRLSGVCWLG